MDSTILTYHGTPGNHWCTLTEGERDILAELNEDAFADALSEWADLTEEEQEAAREQTRLEIEAADREAALYWASMAQQAR
jgi:glycosyltransferase involved in cell wall biosynthesis